MTAYISATTEYFGHVYSQSPAEELKKYFQEKHLCILGQVFLTVFVSGGVD